MQNALPGTVDEWLTLLIHLGTVAVAVGGFLWYVLKTPLVAQIDGLGGRVKECEDRNVVHETRLAEHSQTLRDAAHDRKELHDRVGRTEGSLVRLVTALERNRDAHMEADGEIRERLVRIETKLDAITKETR